MWFRDVDHLYGTCSTYHKQARHVTNRHGTDPEGGGNSEQEISGRPLLIYDVFPAIS